MRGRSCRTCGEEEAAVARQHAAYFLRWPKRPPQPCTGRSSCSGSTLLEAEHDNLRAALDTGRRRGGAGCGSLRLAAALWPFWEARGYLSEGRHHLRAALQQSGLPDAPERAQALLGAARLALHQGDLDEADTFAAGEPGAVPLAGRLPRDGSGSPLPGRGGLCQRPVRRPQALFAEGLEACRQSGWTQGSALALVKLGAVAMMLGELTRARSPLEEGLALAETLGDAPTLAFALYERGLSGHCGKADTPSAGTLLEQSVEIWRRLGHKQATAEALGALGRLAGRQGDPARAISFLEQAAATYRELGARIHLAWTLQELGNVHYAAGAYAQARAAYEESLGIFRELNDRHGIACAGNNLGMTCFHLGDPAGAQALHREALAIYQSRRHGEGMTWSLERLGLAEARLGDAVRAARMLGAAGAAREGLGIPMARWDQADWDQAVAALRAGLTDRGLRGRMGRRPGHVAGSGRRGRAGYRPAGGSGGVSFYKQPSRHRNAEEHRDPQPVDGDVARHIEASCHGWKSSPDWPQATLAVWRSGTRMLPRCVPSVRTARRRRGQCTTHCPVCGRRHAVRPPSPFTHNSAEPHRLSRRAPIAATWKDQDLLPQHVQQCGPSRQAKRRDRSRTVEVAETSAPAFRPGRSGHGRG